MKKTILLSTLFMFSFTFGFDISYSAKSFLWKEFDDRGKQLLKESGFLHEVGFSHNFETNLLYFKPYIGLELGSVEYDGATQSGTPVKSNTNYWGVLTKLPIGKNIKGFYIESGIGYNYWKRNIETTNKAIGYTETWSETYIPLKVGLKIQQNQAIFYTFGEYRFILKTKNEPSIFPVSLEPKTGTHFSIGLGAKKSHFFMEICYSYDKWKKSDAEYYQSYAIYQPESKKEVLKITFGYSY